MRSAYLTPTFTYTVFLSHGTLTPQDLHCLAESHPEVLAAILLLPHILEVNGWTTTPLAQLLSLEWLAASTFLLHGLESSVSQKAGTSPLRAGNPQDTGISLGDGETS